MASVSVRYADGTPSLTSTDVSAEAFGETMSFTRSWSDVLNDSLLGDTVGNHWMSNALPHLQVVDGPLVETETSTIVRVRSGMGQQFFDYDGEFFSARFNVRSLMTWDSGNAEINVLDPDGSIWTFFDFTPIDGTKGKLKGYVDGNGVETIVDYDSGSQPVELVREYVRDPLGDELTTRVSMLIDYDTGLPQTVTLRRQSCDEYACDDYVMLEQAHYMYYGNEDEGNTNDLKLVEVEVGPSRQEVGSLSYSTGEVTVTLNGHGYSDGDRVHITGADPDDYNGLYTIEYINANSFKYDIATSPSSNTGVDVFANKIARTTYYRYETASGAHDGLVTHVVNPRSYERLREYLSNLEPPETDPFETDDAVIEQFADYTFDYQSSTHLVSQVVAQGEGCGCDNGFGAFTYTYDDNESWETGMNHWARKIIEILPGSSGEPNDHARNIVYVNEFGQVLLSVTKENSSSTNQYLRYFKYDEEGREILRAEGAAVIGYNEAYLMLVDEDGGNMLYLADSAGMITTTVYGSSTTADPDYPAVVGDVEGYYKQTLVQRGESGTPQALDLVEYRAYEAPEGVVYVLGEHTQYAGAGGTDGRTTLYTYDWVADTFQAESFTVTYPTITEAKNGSETAQSEIQVLDVLGRPVWHKDAVGVIHYRGFDDATGAVVVSIDDFDTDLTGELLPGDDVPGGWDADGLHLITVREVDDLGSIIKEIDPAGNVHYARHDYIEHETRSYPGWTLVSGDTYTTTGPISVQRDDWRLGYSESFTYSGTIEAASGEPSGREPIGTLQSMSRQYMNEGGQVTHSDVYYSFTGPLAYDKEADLGDEDNYHRTLFKYDERGRQDGMLNAEGTITRSAYDFLGRKTSEWVGLNDNDAGGQPDWVPFIDSDTSNMVKVRDYLYDNYRSMLAPPSAPTLGQTSTGALGARTYYVKLTYVTVDGETLPSSSSTLAISANNVLTVTTPGAMTGALSYNVYAGTSANTLKKQNASPISLASGWTEPGTGLLTNTALAPGDVIGDGNLTQVVEYPAAAGSQDRVTHYFYDWRDRLIASKSGVKYGSDGSLSESDGVNRVISYRALNNLDELTGSYLYDGDGVAIADGNTDGVPDAPSSSLLRAQTIFSIDDRGQIFRERIYSVDQTSGGTPTDSISTYFWYDARGYLIKMLQPGGLVTKTSRDGAGRVTVTYLSDGGGDDAPGAAGNWADADDVSGDIVLSQGEYAYDVNGNVILVTQRERFHTATGTNTLQDRQSATRAGRVSYMANWYDAANRLIASAQIGTNEGLEIASGTSTGGSSSTVTSSGFAQADDYFNGYTLLLTNAAGELERTTVTDFATSGDTFTVSPNFSASPASGLSFMLVTDALLTRYSYDSAGRLKDVTDPRGTVNRTEYDARGLVTRTIEAYVNGSPSDDDDRITVYTYNRNGQVKTLTADLSGTDQTTEYVYGATWDPLESTCRHASLSIL